MPIEEMIDEQQMLDPQADGQGQGEVHADPQAVDPQQQAQPVQDERTLPRWIRDLKVSRPQDFTAAKDAFFGQKTLSEKIKDRDLDKIFGYLDENGGLDGLSTSRQELEASKQELDTLLADVAAGKPEIAERLFEVAGAKGGDIARAIMSQLSQRDPESWNDMLVPVFASTIMSGQVAGLDGKTPTTVPNLLSEARYAMQYATTPEQKAQVAEAALNSITGFLSGFVNAKPRDPGQSNPQKTSALDEREAALNKRESEEFTSGVTKSLGTEMKTDIEAALKTYFERAPNDKDKRELAVAAVWREVNDKLSGDKDFTAKWERFLAAKDSAGAMRLAAGARKKILDGIATRVGRSIYGQPSPVKAPAQPRQQQRPASPSPSAFVDGFDEIWAR